MSTDTRPVADINVTPLIDVMLVLLIIFMTVTPVARHALEAALPRPPSPGFEPPPAAAVIAVDASGFTLNGTPALTLAELRTGLRDILTTRADKTVFIRSVGAVRYSRVIDAVDAARGVGADRIGLVPERPD